MECGEYLEQLKEYSVELGKTVFFKRPNNHSVLITCISTVSVLRLAAVFTVFLDVT